LHDQNFRDLTMAKKNKKFEETEETFAQIEETLGRTEQFVESNKKYLSYIVLAVLGAIILIFAYINMVKEPAEKEAYSAIFPAEHYFEIDSLDWALNGDGTNMGFLDIIDEYGSTKSGNLANYYAGACYLKLAAKDESMKEEYLNDAIDHLNDFDSDDIIVKAMALGMTGDAYMELGDMDKAISYYNKAAKHQENDFTTPLFLKKLGMTYSMQGDHEKALEAFNKIKTDYYRSAQGQDIKKYIGREEGYLNK